MYSQQVLGNTYIHINVLEFCRFVTQGKPGLTHLTEHVINVENHPPIKQRYYSVSLKIHEEIVAEVDSMLANDVIEPSSSGWSIPIVRVRKTDGTFRFVSISES